VPAAARARLRELADRRVLRGKLAPSLRALVDRWHGLGYLHAS
jgi:hypothetical protein